MDNSNGQSLKVSDLISNAPLDLSGKQLSSTAPKAQPPQQSARQPQTQQMQTQAPAIPAERITRIRTFFTKLHVGAVKFMDDQVADWLEKNPDIYIKKVNVVVGELQGKKTEPNVIITVWY